MLQFGDSWDERAVPDREHYEAWRDGADEAAAAAEGVLANRRKYGIHLDGMAHRGEGLASVLSRVRQVLADDDRHIAASLVSQREGEDPRVREDRIARLLDDPDKLQEMRKQREAETRQRTKDYARFLASTLMPGLRARRRRKTSRPCLAKRRVRLRGLKYRQWLLRP